MPQMLPTIVFFPGAFADPSCFDAISQEFQKSGYPTLYTYFSTLNPADPTAVSTSDDAEEVREKYLSPLIDNGNDVIVLAHSYGGVVGGAAAAGLSKSSRASEGKTGGVVGLLYLVGNIVGEGQSLLQAIGGAYPPFIKEHHPTKGVAVIDPVMETLYGDVDSTQATKLQAAMIPHALAAFETPSTAPAWAEPAFDGRRAYIRTLDDQCNPLFVQDIWIEGSGVKWDIADMKTSHCPFISRPAETANVVISLIKGWK